MHCSLTPSSLLRALFGALTLVVVAAPGCTEKKEQQGAEQFHEDDRSAPRGRDMNGRMGEGPGRHEQDEAGPAAVGMGGPGPGPEIILPLDSIDPGLVSKGSCMWMQTCGTGDPGPLRR